MFIANEEEKKFLFEYVPGHHYREIVDEFNSRFETQVTMEQIRGFIHRYKLNTGFDGRFQKGNISANKGKHPKSVGRMAETQFKKGNMPANYRPVGSERINSDGYVEVKVADPDKWKLKHRVVYEAAYGDIPDSHIVIFKDNNRQNCEPENLLLITRKQHAVMNHLGLCKYTGELKETALAISDLRSAINQSKKRKKGEGK